VSPLTMNGTITVVQERRFQLVDDGGVAHLFLLAHDAAADPAALEDALRSGARVRVSYRDGDPRHLIAHVATALERIPQTIGLPA